MEVKNDNNSDIMSEFHEINSEDNDKSIINFNDKKEDNSLKIFPVNINNDIMGMLDDEEDCSYLFLFIFIYFFNF